MTWGVTTKRYAGELVKAIHVNHSGGPEQLILCECAIPEPGPDEVLVKLRAIGVNFFDIYIREGLHKPSAYPYIPGKEGSGEVVKLGRNVSHFKLGERVAFCKATSGAYAEYTTLHVGQAVHIPDGIDDEIAAAVMMQGLTAYFLSHLTIALNQQHKVLIHAGAGGVGLLLIQMARLLGAKIFATASTEEKLDIAQRVGAHTVINYRKENFAEKILSYTEGKGVNVIYDSVGKDTFDQNIASLAMRGLLVVYGKSSGRIPPFDISLLSPKSLYLTRPDLYHYTSTHKELLAMSKALFEYIQNGKIKIHIGQRYALADAAEAHRNLEQRQTIGKSILLLS